MSTFQPAGDASAFFANAGASPALKPAAGCTSICSSGHGTPSQGPLKQPKHGTVAKCLESLAALPDPFHAAEDSLLFQRAVSTASTEFTASTDFHRLLSEDDGFTPFASPFIGSQRWSQEGLAELPEWRLQDVRVSDADGAKWTVAGVGCPFAKRLEEEFDDVTALFQKKFGINVDEEVEGERLFEDADGTKWQVTEGRGLLVGLEDRLEDLKGLYKRKFGLDVDGEEDESLFEDADGTKWQVAEGRGDLSVSEDRLEDLHALYRMRKFVLDEEDESFFEDADGTKWQVTEGCGPLAALEERLHDIKALYKRKYGLDLEEEDESLFEDVDGTKWQVTEGRGLLTGLEDRLDDLKALYKSKFGLDLEKEEDESLFEDADGTKWQVTEGCGPLAALEERLQGIKALHKRKYGVDVDDVADEVACGSLVVEDQLDILKAMFGKRGALGGGGGLGRGFGIEGRVAQAGCHTWCGCM
ncbi:unnamed protein product [Prorocentrum cordatum]|uniref:Uncharacterized protein n=1 Tax=Prorocentrum cordatum TaxID=2364126 RepID=A0ABN9T060_9DINO|nr:unnamed protein product [Polarella glacialis]